MVRTGHVEPSGPFALFGSPIYEDLVNNARVDFWFGDHGFFGRGRFYRCAKNARMFLGTSGDDNPRRFRAFRIPVREWRRRGSYIVLCPNSPAFLARHGAADWTERTVERLKAFTDRPIRIRQKRDRRPLSHDLIDAWAVVTFASNAAVEAVLAGVPAFCTRPCAGLVMGCDDLSRIENPAMPNGREQWAARLASHQWTLDEMARGDLWRVLG
jgi:hypothetical protein